jgi:carboxymethylenebutenolidase
LSATMRTVDTADGVMEIYEALPADDARGAVIVIQEAFGVNNHIQDVTRRFADARFAAVAPAIFHRAGGGTADYKDFQQVMKLFSGLTDDGLLADIDACVAHLAALGYGPASVGVVGFCFGGRVAFLAAVRRKLGAAVAFYPGGLVEPGPLPFAPLIDEVGSLQTPWLGLLGEDDASIPTDQIARLRDGLAAVTAVDHDVEVFAGAGHAFHCDARPEMYRAEAARAGWQRTLDWLAEHLAS